MSEDRIDKNGAYFRGDSLMSFREFLAEAEGMLGENRKKGRWKPNAAARILRSREDRKWE